MILEGTFLQELGNDFILPYRIVNDLTAAETVFRIREEIVQTDHSIAGQIGCDMIRIGNTDIRSGVGGDIGNDIVVDLAVISIQTQIDMDIRIILFKILNGLFIDHCLCLVGVILGPESDFILAACIEGFGDLKSSSGS